MTNKTNNTDLYSLAENVARYFGFSALDEVLAISTRDFADREMKMPKQSLLKNGPLASIDRPAIMKAYLDLEWGALPQPILIYHTEPLTKGMPDPHYGGKDAVLFSLEILGTNRSIAEALLFKTALVIMNEAGFKDISISINSLGDRESIARFTREVNNFCKKNFSAIPAHCKANLKKDVFKLLSCTNEKCSAFRETLPKPISSLSENSRVHFSEVLEYLESMDVPYSINNFLIGGKDFYTKTIFEMISEDKENGVFPKRTFNPVLARGGRYDDLAKKIGNKKEIPAVGLSISLGGLGITAPKAMKKSATEKTIPTIGLVHIGFEAKIKSLVAIETLRKAKIPIYQTLSKDRLTVQVTNAERLEIPYLIIIGQKEAMDNTAIIRDLARRSQETIPLPDMPAYIKELLKKQKK